MVGCKLNRVEARGDQTGDPIACRDNSGLFIDLYTTNDSLMESGLNSPLAVVH